MRYALADGQRVEAYRGGRARCRACDGEVIGKCGTQRAAHWAHRGIRSCDSWAEPETDWHRAWKDKFPIECQEFIQHDAQSGEKHIADVRTSYGLVIEFQHSHLDPIERIARERFYGNMVWVVDGVRLERDFPRFDAGKAALRRTQLPGHFLLPFPEDCFSAMWLDSTVPVIFDFRGVDEGQQTNIYKEMLWCLFPGRVAGSAVVVGMLRAQFVEIAPSRPQLFPVQETLLLFKEQHEAAEVRSRQSAATHAGWRRPRRSRF